MPSKNVSLNDKVLEILDILPGSSASDKIMNLYNLTENYADRHIRYFFHELRFFYPLLGPVIDELESFMLETFNWLKDEPDERLIEKRLIGLSGALGNLNNWLGKKIREEK